MSNSGFVLGFTVPGEDDRDLVICYDMIRVDGRDAVDTWEIREWDEDGRVLENNARPGPIWRALRKSLLREMILYAREMTR